MIRFFLIVLLLSAGPSFTAVASGKGADHSSQLKDIERALKHGRDEKRNLGRKTKKLKSDVNELSGKLVAAARMVQDYEAEVNNLAVRLKELEIEEKTKTAFLLKRRKQFSHVLMALERLARYPPEAMISQPLSPSDTVRSAILLRAAVPAIESKARDLRSEIASLGSARREISVRRAEMAKASAGLKEQRRRLDMLLASKKRNLNRVIAKRKLAARKVRRLARQAKNLRELMARLEAERKFREGKEGKNKANGSVRGFRGNFPQPAVGKIVMMYGQATESGMTHKGISIETMPGGQVVATHRGRVVFAGPFRGYGQLLIIEHGQGYHSLLAGMGRIDSVIGQMVTGGEPVGIMGDPDNGRPVLYLELRRNGKPINPLPWLAARKSKVSG